MRARDVTSQVFLLGTNAENDPIAGKTSDMAGYADDGTLCQNRVCGLQERRLILLREDYQGSAEFCAALRLLLRYIVTSPDSLDPVHDLLASILHDDIV